MNNAQRLAASALGKITRKEVEERLHLGVECLVCRRIQAIRRDRERANIMDAYLLRVGILDGVDEGREFVAHGLGSDTGGGSLEVDVACATDARVEGVALGH